MTKRQKQNLGMGLVFLVVGVVVFAVLKMMEGTVVVKNNQEYVYTVDPNVYLIMFIISLIGLLIIMLTVAEYRWQARTGEEVNVIDLIRKKEKVPEQKILAEPAKEVPEPKQKQEKTPNKKKKPEPPGSKAPQPAREKAHEPVKRNRPERTPKQEPEKIAQNVPEPVHVQEMLPVLSNGPELAKEPEPIQVEAPALVPEIAPLPVMEEEPEPVPIQQPEPIIGKEPEPIQTKVPEPAPQAIPNPMIVKALESAQTSKSAENWQDPAKPERFIPIKVKALGRCPMCGKVIVLGQVECIKCGWKVITEKIVQLDQDIDPDN